ncbi:hypothetical protein Tco_1295011 [Tanacetum coccineum]
MRDYELTSANGESVINEENKSYLHEPPTISAQHAAFTRNVKRRLITSQNVSPANAARLITKSKENFRSADILGSHDTSDSTTVPVRRIFDRFRNMPFRNMPTDNVERDFVSQTVSALGKRPLSTTPFSHAYVVRGVLPTPSELYIHTTSRIFDCFRNADVNYFPSNIVVHIGSTPRGDISRTSVCQSALPTLNHTYLCLDSNGCVISPEVISFPNRTEETKRQRHLPAEYLGDHA